MIKKETGEINKRKYKSQMHNLFLFKKMAI
jgi:hypothetical protein